jgi:DNA-binding IclR family transcriptional regulator
MIIQEKTNMESIGSIEKALGVFNLLRKAPYSMNLTEIAAGLGMSKPGALKIVRVLEENAFLLKDPQSKQYSLGPALFRLGNLYREQKGITEIVQPVLHDLTDFTKATSYLTLWEKNEAFLILVEENLKEPCYTLKGGVVGDAVPIHCGASAKLLAAYQDKALVTGILEKRGLERKGSRTIVSMEDLFREYASIREKGYALSEDEYEDGLIALSVPIAGLGETVRMALSISGNKAWLSREGILEHLPQLQQGARQVAYKLAFRK